MDRIKDVVRNWSRLLAGRALALALATASLLVLRSGPELAEQGRFFWFLSIQAVASLVVLSGLGTALVPKLARGNGGEEFAAHVASRARRRGLALASLFALLAVVVAPDDLWVAASAVSIAGQSLLLGSAPSLATGNTKLLTRIEVAGRASSLCVFALLHVFEVATAGPYLLAWTLPPVLAAMQYARAMSPDLAAVLGVRQWFLRVASATRPLDSRERDRSVVQLSLGDVFRAGYFQGSPILIGVLASASQLEEAFAHFGFAHRLFMLAALVPAALSTVVAGPLASDESASLVRTRGSLVWLPLCALPVAAATIVLAMFDTTHEGHALASLALLLLALPAMFLSAAVLPWLIAHSRERQVLAYSIAGFAATTLLVVGLWPFADLRGGAVAIALGEILVATLALRRFAVDTRTSKIEVDHAA